MDNFYGATSTYWECAQMESHDFGWALGLLKQGRAVARRGWGDAYIYLKPEWNEFSPYFVFKRKNGRFLFGWTAPVSDMLADDWEEVLLPLNELVPYRLTCQG